MTKRKRKSSRVAPAKAMKLWGHSVSLNLDYADSEARDGADLARVLVRLAEQTCERQQPPDRSAWREIGAIGRALWRAIAGAQGSIDSASTMFGVVCSAAPGRSSELAAP
jgi:hypothetical protein